MLDEALRTGTLHLTGRLYDASNASFTATLEADGAAIRCVYKPTAGERPLRDFPDGTLAFREVAAYRVSACSGWDIVPLTVLREDGPHGGGMAQLWVDTDETVDVVQLLTDGDVRLRSIAVFDAVVNNTDRKGGHLLVRPDGHVHGVDHGVTFSVQPKLRTILWGWRGQPLDESELTVLRRLREALDGDLGRDLRRLIDRSEVRATKRRVDDLILTGTFPYPSPGWPAVPWPPL